MQIFSIPPNSSMYAHPLLCPERSFSCYFEPVGSCVDYAVELAQQNSSNVTVATLECPRERLLGLMQMFNSSLLDVHVAAMQYLTRRNARLLKALDFHRKYMNFTEPYIGVHIRTGKKFSGHDERVQYDKVNRGYPPPRMARIALIIGRALNISHFFLSVDYASDRRKFLLAMEQFDPSARVSYFPDSAFPLMSLVTKYGKLELVIGEYYKSAASDEGLAMLSNVIFLSQSQFVLATGASQVDLGIRLWMRQPACLFEVMAGHCGNMPLCKHDSL
eukprot:TRINITY_DN20780_c0_g1_i2.p1 TRINITY_DN20780_c0_g1~~TRINITY_DN20780_c0_g1_i2.p1  ORF type:complete len:275 (-),score=37.95 TRINITY_DN20780_c0_g1_i2:30-854(-)